MALTNKDTVGRISTDSIRFTCNDREMFGFPTSQMLSTDLSSGQSRQVVFSFTCIAISFGIAVVLLLNSSENAGSLYSSQIYDGIESDPCATDVYCGYLG